VYWAKNFGEWVKSAVFTGLASGGGKPLPAQKMAEKGCKNAFFGLFAVI
jgi:hypothetical protein